MKTLVLLLLGALLASSAARADKSSPGEAMEPAPEHWSFKLTPSRYVTANETDATDLNLRANHGAHAFWVGHYRRTGEFQQTRTGYEYTARFPFGQLVPSLQAASHGFLGGSVNAQVGSDFYGILGFGRTNARDYYNLNFDPNDSIAYGLGTSRLPGSNLSLFTVKDNRLGTGQMVTHLLWRFLPDDHRRWTLDLSKKHGRPSADGEPVSGAAFSVTYDYDRFFLRWARDRKVNFSPDDQTRLSLGMRF